MHPKVRYRVTAFALATGMLVAATGCSMTHQQRTKQAEQHWGQVRAKVKLQMAEQQFDRGQTAEAMKLLNEALAWSPENSGAQLLLARCLLEEGKFSAATRAIERAAECSDRDDAAIASIQGLIAERKGNLDAAIEYYRKAREIDDTVVGYLTSEAECLVAQSKTHEARALLNDELLNYGNDPSLYALIGEIALRDGDNIAAEQAFRSVLATGDQDPVVAEQYALLAVRTGQYHEALSVLEPLIAKKGEKNVSSSVLCAAGESLLALQRTEPAKRMLRNLLERDPDNADAWMLLARAGIATKDVHTTRSAATNLRRLAPRDPQTYVIDAYACVQEERFTAADKSLRDALALDQQNVTAHCLRGLVAEREQNPDAARGYYQRALSIDPHCTWASAALQRLSANGGAPMFGDAQNKTDGNRSIVARTASASESQ